MLIDLRSRFPELSGRVAEKQLVRADITVNKNMVPFDSRSPFQTSGLRVGTPAVTSRGLGTKEMKEIVGLIDTVLASAALCVDALSLKAGVEPDAAQAEALSKHDAVIEEVRHRVHNITSGLPLNKY